jgi:hypothetical protein
MLLHDLLSLEGETVLNKFDTLLIHRSRMNAALLVYIAVIDSRNLYLARGFESMKGFLIGRMALTEDAAAKRLQVARLAKQMPRLFAALAKGELSVYDVRLLAARLTPENVDSLVDECAHKSADEIGRILATHFPRAESLELPCAQTAQLVVPQQECENRNADRHSGLPEFIPPISNTPRVRSKIEALSATRFTLQVTLPATARDKLRRLQDLLAHAVPNGDVAEVIERSFDAHLEKLERQKFGIGAKKRGAPTVRSIPAQIRKAVYDRDGGQCAHVYADGRRCPNKAKLEFDHIIPVAKGGKTTIDNLRLLCRAHNQHAADQAFGQAFMDRKRANRRRFSGA